MKLLISAFFLILISLNVMAADQFFIYPGKFHKGGTLKAEIVDVNNSQNGIKIKLSYQIYKRVLVPIPAQYLKGEAYETLPSMFTDERGYLELETVKQMQLKYAKIIHLGRVNNPPFTNGHLIKIKPNDGQTEIEVFYHPHIPGLGWGKLSLILHTNIPLLKNYYLEADREF